jgi:hypothetical protein
MASKDCCEIFASEHSGGRVIRCSCHIVPTCWSVCMADFAVSSTEIRRQLHGFFSNRGIQTSAVLHFYCLLPNAVSSVSYVRFVIYVQKRDADGVHSKIQMFLCSGYKDKKRRLPCLKFHLLLNALFFTFLCLMR